MRIETAHTSELAPETLAAARGLVDRVFAHVGWTDEDWEHVLGGMHALAWSGPELIGHVAVVQRRLLLGGRTLRTGYVEGLAVREDHRRQGHASALLDVAERTIRGAYELGALSPTDEAVPLYDGRGWLRWRGARSPSRPAAGSEPRRTTTPSSSCPSRPRSIWMRRSPAIGALATSGDAAMHRIQITSNYFERKRSCRIDQVKTSF